MSPVSTQLLDEIDQLHPKQREAVLHDGNVVVRAGPGSGKTRTLVARVGWLLETQTSGFRGVACITYTNAAAAEARQRLRALGVARRDQLACSTVHSFCLNEILRPFASMHGMALAESSVVLGDGDREALLQSCFDEIGIAETAAKWRDGEVTKIRRALASGELLDIYDPREIAASRLYEKRLQMAGEVDYESMVIRALDLVGSSGHARDLLRAKYPHLVVDEYQDLGGALHNLVTTLCDLAGITIFAAGDADQSVFGFSGADPRYMAELAQRADFHEVGLDLNYRSGVNIIRASEAALGHNRGRSPAPGLPPGEVAIARVDGALDEHAAEAVRVAHELFDRGVPAERVGILYPSRGPVLEAVLEQLARSELPYFYERDEALPTGSLSRLIQRCASRAVVNAQIHLASATSRATAEDVIRRTQAPNVLDLERELLNLRREAGLAPPSSRLHLAREIQRCVDAPASTSDDVARPWLTALIDRLDLSEVSVRHPDRDNARALTKLEALVEDDDYTIADLAAGVEVVGKLMLTTYHSAKGRQFQAVILPGLVNGLVPRQINARGLWRAPTGAELAEQRRAFFVAVSRAEAYAHLITGPGYFTTNGYWRGDGPSDFLTAVEAAIASSA